MANISPGPSLLSAAYEELDLHAGRLVSGVATIPQSVSPDDWRSIGDWLLLVDRMGAERIFFVGDDPVIVFAELSDGSSEEDVLEMYRRAWSLSRPRCLFLAIGAELRVYALSKPPPRADKLARLKPIEVVRSAVEVAERLADFRRDRVEAGLLFDRPEFARQAGWADERLLRDVRNATSRLEEARLPRLLAHALIERVILIRYLEDREVLTEDYFDDIASQSAAWVELLESERGTVNAGPRSSFVASLRDPAFAYAVFADLAERFNGDLFVPAPNESSQITSKHLVLIHDLLVGAGFEGQQQLFLWAYDFSVVPTSLISSMYEQFYRSEQSATQSGTHYTPPELVEYVLAETLTDEVLAKSPRVCDLACGSGIFLVEAFRRIVRFEWRRQGGPPTPAWFKDLLLTRISGLDLNGQAVRLAAFSLYLAFLNYQSPQDIRSAGPLPKLIDPGDGSIEHPVLAIGDAFAPLKDEPELARAPDVPRLPWTADAFDIIVGNPPWDEPKEQDSRLGDPWAEQYELPVRHRNPSQQFLWRTLRLIGSEGIGALLVGTPSFHNPDARKFRDAWVREARVESFVDFSTSRSLFFKEAIAPFAFVKFRQMRESEEHFSVSVRSVRPTTALASARALAYANEVRRRVDQRDLYARDYRWKLFTWGSHRDDALLSRLASEPRLIEVLPEGAVPAFGFQPGSTPPTDALANVQVLRRMDWWGPLERSAFEGPPSGTKRETRRRIFDGQRIVISEGVRAGFGPNARLIDGPLGFRHTFYCIPLPGMPEWQAKWVLGVMLSRLGRYRMFMASAAWGVWHDKFNVDDFHDIPMRLPTRESKLTRTVSSAIDRLYADDGDFRLVSPNEPTVPLELLAPIDEAVYRFFELEPEERDLVDDFHDYVLPLVGRAQAWKDLPAVTVGKRASGVIGDVRHADPTIRRYLRTFLEVWNQKLGDSGELTWRVIAAPRVPMLAVVFETMEPGGSPPTPDIDAPDWEEVLRRYSTIADRPVTAAVSRQGVIRAVTDTAIILLKRGDILSWTASAALDDAEATMAQAMRLAGG